MLFVFFSLQQSQLIIIDTIAIFFLSYICVFFLVLFSVLCPLHITLCVKERVHLLTAWFLLSVEENMRISSSVFWTEITNIKNKGVLFVHFSYSLVFQYVMTQPVFWPALWLGNIVVLCHFSSRLDCRSLQNMSLCFFCLCMWFLIYYILNLLLQLLFICIISLCICISSCISVHCQSSSSSDRGICGRMTILCMFLYRFYCVGSVHSPF